MTYTNASLRALLGKHGFIEDPARPETKEGKNYSYWNRATSEVILVEQPNDEPFIMTRFGNKLDPQNLGWRNENTRQPDEGTPNI
jgi:hypothetical protein